MVMVPSALVGAGFTVQVGGNSIDNFNKNWVSNSATFGNYALNCNAISLT